MPTEYFELSFMVFSLQVRYYEVCDPEAKNQNFKTGCLHKLVCKNVCGLVQLRNLYEFHDFKRRIMVFKDIY